jgi:hypothetical protein
MNLIPKVIRLVAVGMLAAASAHAEPAEVIFKKLMEATIANDHEAFIAVTDEAMAAALTKPMLQAVSQQIKPRAEQGYEPTFLGELNQGGYNVHLWRLRFKDGGDDVLATLSVKDGKAGGFYLR